LIQKTKIIKKKHGSHYCMAGLVGISRAGLVSVSAFENPSFAIIFWKKV
jgi:hypothetical protein